MCAMSDPAFISMVSHLSPNFLQHLTVTLGSNSGDNKLLHLFHSPKRKSMGVRLLDLHSEQFEHI
jgi:hypothetical protein